MTVYAITHPQALAAVWLACKLEGLSPGLVARIVRASGIPLRLFELAVILRSESC